MSDFQKRICNVITSYGYNIITTSKKDLRIMHNGGYKKIYIASLTVIGLNDSERFYIRSTKPIPESTRKIFNLNEKDHGFELTNDNYKDFLINYLLDSMPSDD